MTEKTKKNTAKGGFARAEKLTRAERLKIAKKANIARWTNPPIPKAVFGSPDRPVVIAGIEINCYVLDDTTRLLVQNGMRKVLGIKNRYKSFAEIITTTGFISFIDAELREKVVNPILFKRESGGRTAYGYSAETLVDLCEAILKARDANLVPKHLQYVCDRADMIIRSLAKVGIVALVDEVTGFQEARDKKALQTLLDKYLLDEYAKWAKRFPDEFYQQLFRLRGWSFDPNNSKRTQAVAWFTKNLVYQRLAPGILKELEVRNPILENGRRKSKHFQWFTDDTGIPALNQHFHTLLAFMRIGDNYEHFKFMIDRALPVHGETIQMSFFKNSELFGEEFEKAVFDV